MVIKLEHNPHLIMVVVFKDKNLVDTKVVAVVAVATTVAVVELVVTVAQVQGADLVSIILDLTGQALRLPLQEMIMVQLLVVVEHLVVRLIQIILAVVLVLLLLEQETMVEMEQFI